MGKVGDHVFLLGSDGYVPNDVEGDFFVTINDDWDGRYGAGFADNIGSIEIVIIPE